MFYNQKFKVIHTLFIYLLFEMTEIKEIIKVDYRNWIELEHPTEHVLEQSDGQERSKVLFQAVPSEQTHVTIFKNSLWTIYSYDFDSTLETFRDLPPTILPTQKLKSRFSTRKL